jgi:hypothetical protein
MDMTRSPEDEFEGGVPMNRLERFMLKLALRRMMWHASKVIYWGHRVSLEATFLEIDGIEDAVEMLRIEIDRQGIAGFIPVTDEDTD